VSTPELTKGNIRNHLKKKWRQGGTCNVCSANSWIVVEEEFMLTNRASTTSFPVALVVCEECGSVNVFSSGIIKKNIS